MRTSLFLTKCISKVGNTFLNLNFNLVTPHFISATAHCFSKVQNLEYFLLFISLSVEQLKQTHHKMGH